MALWQFELELLPRAWFTKTGEPIDVLFRNGNYDASIAWRDHQPTSDIQSRMSGVLPARKSWSNELKLWGDEKGSDIQVWYENNLVESMGIRVDVRGKVVPLLIKIVDLANALDCVFLLPEKKSLIRSNIFELKKALSQSDAFSFVEDPQQFIARIESEEGGAT